MGFLFDSVITDVELEKFLADHALQGEREWLLQFFDYKHLRDDLQVISKEFARLAVRALRGLPRNPERTVTLRKLKEAKDAAICAFLGK